MAFYSWQRYDARRRTIIYLVVPVITSWLHGVGLLPPARDCESRRVSSARRIDARSEQRIASSSVVFEARARPLNQSAVSRPGHAN